MHWTAAKRHLCFDILTPVYFLQTKIIVIDVGNPVNNRYNGGMRDDYFNDLNNFLRYTRRRRRLWSLFLNFSTFVLVVVFTFTFINYPVLAMRTTYTVNAGDKDIKPEIDSKNPVPPTKTPPPPKQEKLEESEKPDPTKATTNGEIPESKITIDSIGVNAPIIWNANARNVQDQLNKGVVHIVGSAVPGDDGNIFLTGHSSDLWWTPGEHKTVFALLDKLENGNEINLSYNGGSFQYRVYNKEVVSKEDVARFVATDKAQSLTVMTCYPIGTNWRRLMVQAERTDD